MSTTRYYNPLAETNSFYEPVANIISVPCCMFADYDTSLILCNKLIFRIFEFDLFFIWNIRRKKINLDIIFNWISEINIFWLVLVF